MSLLEQTHIPPVVFNSRMAEVYDLLFGGPGKESLSGCKDIILQATQALLVGKLQTYNDIIVT